MTAAVTNTPAGNSSSSGPLVIGGVIVALLALLYILGAGNLPLERSAAGFNGLVAWLKANDVEARTFERGLLVEGEVALRILPLYDTDLLADREVPEAREEVIAQTSENDLPFDVLRAKINSLPTLVVLPKWRTGMRALGVAHADLLIPDLEMNRLLRQIGLRDARIRRDPEGFATDLFGVAGDSHEIGLMHAQQVRGSGCAPVIGPAEAPILVHCVNATAKRRARRVKADKEKGDAAAVSSGDDLIPGEFWLLSDPDLWSNHGLLHAGNAAVALSFLQSFDLGKPVIVDVTLDDLTVEEGRQTGRYERSWEDFARMFAWPFTVIWIAFGAVGLLVLWRAVTRYGPTARIADDEPQAAKTVSIDAKARLLRLANHDAELLRSYVRARLAHLASELFGAHQPPGKDPLEILTALIARSKPDLARELATASDIPATEGDLLGRLDRFETCYDRIRHDLGRTANPG